MIYFHADQQYEMYNLKMDISEANNFSFGQDIVKRGKRIIMNSSQRTRCTFSHCSTCDI